MLKAVSRLKSSGASCFGCGLSGLCLLTTHFILKCSTTPKSNLLIIFFQNFGTLPSLFIKNAKNKKNTQTIGYLHDGVILLL